MTDQLKYKAYIFENQQISTQEQLKTLHQFLSLIQELSESEEKYSKSLDKILQSYLFNQNNQGYQRFFDILKDNINTIQKMSNNLSSKLKEQKDNYKEIIQKHFQIIKKYQETYENHESFCFQNFTLIGKIKDRYHTTSRDYEDTVLQFGSYERNLECTDIVKQKLASKIQTLHYQQRDQEQQYKVQIGQHSKAANNFEQELEILNKDLQDMEQNRSDSLKDLLYNSMNIQQELLQQQLNHITDYKHHLQMDIQEKIEIKQFDPTFQYRTEKECYIINKQQIYESYLTELSNIIIRECVENQQLKLTFNNQNPVGSNQEFDPQNYPYTEDLKVIMHKFIQEHFQNYETDIPSDWISIIQRDEFRQNYKTKEHTIADDNYITSNIIYSQYIASNQSMMNNISISDTQILQYNEEKQNNPTQNNMTLEQINELDQEDEINNDKNNVFKTHFKNTQIGRNILFLMKNTIIYSHPKINKNLTEEHLNRLTLIIQEQLYYSICIYMIQSFRTCKKENLSAVAFQNLSKLILIILDVCCQKKDIRGARKIMLMTFTIFSLQSSLINVKVDIELSNRQHDEKIFIQENIRKHKIWKRIDLWKSMIYDSIDEILTNIKTVGSYTNQNNFQQNSLIFSNIISIGQSMIKFKIKKTEIKELITRYAQYFGLYHIQIQEINKMIDYDPKSNRGQFQGTGPSSVSILNTFYEQQIKGKNREIQQIPANLKNNMTLPRKPDFDILKKKN